MILPLCSAEGTQARMKRMRRTLLLITIILLALVAARGVAAAPQSKGSAILTGTVLGPDDRPVAHASVSYQSSGGKAPHVVRADSRGIFTITKLGADRKSTRLNSSHGYISYAVFCLKKKKSKRYWRRRTQ